MNRCVSFVCVNALTHKAFALGPDATWRVSERRRRSALRQPLLRRREWFAGRITRLVGFSVCGVSMSNRQPAVSLIGVPTDIGAGARGAGLGPEALRIAGLGEALPRAAWTCATAATWMARATRGRHRSKATATWMKWWNGTAC